MRPLERVVLETCEVYPGLNCSSWYQMSVPQGWVDVPDPFRWEYDYGMINVTCSFASSRIMRYGMRDGLGKQIRIDAYPQGAAPTKPAGTMWQAPGVITDQSEDIYHYDADTWGGTSGGYIRQAADNIVIGINSHEFPFHNAGVRINTTNYQNLLTMRDSA